MRGSSWHVVGFSWKRGAHSLFGPFLEEFSRYHSLEHQKGWSSWSSLMARCNEMEDSREEASGCRQWEKWWTKRTKTYNISCTSEDNHLTGWIKSAAWRNTQHKYGKWPDYSEKENKEEGSKRRKIYQNWAVFSQLSRLSLHPMLALHCRQ